MKAKLLEGGGIPKNEETKDAGLSIANVRKNFIDGGSGAGNIIAAAVIENNSPPSYVAARVKAHDTGGNCVAFRPQGNKIATAGNDGVVKLWTTTLSSTESKSLRISSGPISSLAFSASGAMIAAGLSNREINLIKIKP